MTLKVTFSTLLFSINSHV